MQFSRDPEALNQYFRQMVPDTGPFDAKVVTDAVSALFDKIGPGVLVTHSHSGGLGWTVGDEEPQRARDRLVRAGQRLRLPRGRSAAIDAAARPARSKASRCRWRSSAKLTRDPDRRLLRRQHSRASRRTNFGEDNWRVRLAMARLWVEAINRHGGDATLVHLPEIGIRGNTHFPFSDLNNVQVADLMSDFLARKGVD